ncbi:hypothetical protein ACVV7P_004049 [Cronobacter sakazakii]
MEKMGWVVAAKFMRK